MPRPKRYDSEAEKQAAYRLRKKNLDLGVEEAVSESTVLRPEMSNDVHPVYPQLKRWEDREYDENGLVLKEQRCGLCNRTWSASISIECPYCHGKRVKIP